MINKTLIGITICIVLFFSGVYAQIVPNAGFTTDLSDWYGMFDAPYSDPGYIGVAKWSPSFGGSCSLYVNGAPQVIGVWTQTRATINSGTNIPVLVTNGNDFSSYGGLFFTIGGEPPYGQ